MNRMAALAVTGFMGSMVNTVAVMGSIYKLLALPYAQVKNVAVDAVWGLIMATVTASEAVVAAVLVAIIGKIMLKFIK